MTDEEIDALIEKIFTEDLKSLYTAENINVRCAKTGDTALMLAADRGQFLLVKRLLERGADPTLRNLDGDSAFTLSLYMNHERIANTLLPYETEQSLNTSNDCGEAALDIAAELGLILLEQAIIAKGGIIRGVSLKENTTPSQMRAEFLISLLQKGPVLRDGSSLPRIMLSKVFVEENGRANFPIGYFDYVFLNPNLRNLMILTDWACKFYKSKIFFFDSKHNEVLRFISHHIGYGFFSPYTNDIFCFYDSPLSIDTIETFFHEAMHLAMKFVYENNCRPYSSQDSDQKNRFETVVKKTRARLCHRDPDFASDLRIEKAFDILCSVYTGYPSKQIASELIARIPQILVSLGIDRGMKWLSQFEELMEYYNTVVMPDIESGILKSDYYSKFVPLQLQSDNANAMYASSPSFEGIMQMLYEQEDSCFILRWLEKVHEKLTLEQLQKIKAAAEFFKYQSTLIAQCGKYEMRNLEKERIRTDKQERESKNKQILNKFFLDPDNEEHLRYWADQVIWPGGRDYGGYRIPHTIANIFHMLDEVSLISISPEELLAEIHKMRKRDSGSKMRFFGNFKMRSPTVEQLRTMQNEDFELSFSPGNDHRV